MTDALRKAAQTLLTALDENWHDCTDDVDSATEALRAALAAQAERDALRKAAQAALEAFDKWNADTGWNGPLFDDAMESLRAALAAQPQQATAEPTLADVVDALNTFNPPDAKEGNEPWSESHYIIVKALPAFIHNVSRAWYSQQAVNPTRSREEVEGDAYTLGMRYPQQAEPHINYFAVQLFANKHHLDYNETCAALRSCLAAQPQAEPVAMTPSRSAFEAAVRKSWTAGYACERFEDGVYKDATLRMAWYLVEATFAAAQPQQDEPVEEESACPTCGEDGGTSCGASNCGLLTDEELEPPNPALEKAAESHARLIAPQDELQQAKARIAQLELEMRKIRPALRAIFDRELWDSLD